MKIRIFLLLLNFFNLSSAIAQEIDLIRLNYDHADIKADQIGMAVSPDGKQIAFAYQDKTIKIFDIAANRFVKRFNGNYSSLFDIQLTSSGNIALIAEKEMQVWNWKEEKILFSFKFTNDVTKTAFSKKKELLAIGEKGGIVEIFDLKNGAKTFEIPGKKNHVSALAFHPNGTSLLVGLMSAINFSPNALSLYDLTSGSEIGKSDETANYTMVTYNESGSEVFCAGLNKSSTKEILNVLDGNTLKVKRKFNSEMNITNSRVPYGGIIFKDKLLTLSLSQSFNAREFLTGSVRFTTKSDKLKMPPIWKFGVGSFHIYPLQSSGEKVIVNASKNNINQIYDSHTNSITGYFFSDSNDDFAVISRDGRVDGTPAALAKVYWTTRGGAQRTSLESTLEKGFAPRLLTQIINEESGSLESFDVDQVVGKVPVVAVKSINGKTFSSTTAVVSTQKKSTIAIEITDNPQEVTEVRLYQNSKLIKTLPATGSNYTFDVSLTSSFGEENFFFVSAGSKSGVDSEKAKFTITYTGASEDKPTLYLITVGINKYKNPKYNLNYAQADADAVEKSMKQSSSTIFKAIVPYTIRNDKAVKSNIVIALDDVRKKSLEQDMVVFYYAGHGVMSGEGADAKEFYIVPTDVTQLYGRDDILKDKAIAASSLKEYAESINAQKQIFILDACQSAGALESVTERGVAEEKAIAQLARSTGTFWITSTGSNQFASEFEKLGHGIFTYSLIEGLDGKADANGDKKLTIRELSTYIENKVPELSEQLKGTAQYPSAYSFGNDFPIAVYK
ncbi:MAG: caspase family protein [Cyclobacteriaceae bacterium]|nr:caspase family protein [Cyclobacteriaceae bacterium]